MSSIELEARIAVALDSPVSCLQPMGDGCVADVRHGQLDDGRRIVVKWGSRSLALEGRMLERLRKAGMPVPEVYHTEDDLLVMSWIEHGGQIDRDAEEHAADLIAHLHNQTAASFGYEEDTVIGGLQQPNPETSSWLEFFRDQRLLYMAGEALKAERLSPETYDRIETLAGRLDTWLDGDIKPSLIHGDLWGGNVLALPGRIVGFIDPAIYYADAEIELAFSTLFNTFGERFFSRYEEYRPLRPDFFKERCELYNLYPLLVHVRLFGGEYVNTVEGTLSRFGC
ncbi:MAG: fructosamine kinase family protein [Rhodospirillales bacterium]|nr:fructosamine kinase family protein [Rhodospirillales bacterium]